MSNKLVNLYRLELNRLRDGSKKTILIHEEGLKDLLKGLKLDIEDVSIEQLDCGILKVMFYWI